MKFKKIDIRGNKELISLQTAVLAHGLISFNGAAKDRHMLQ